MNKIILFGTGFYGQTAYFKMKSKYNILYFIDNDSTCFGTKLFGVPVIPEEKLKEVYSPEVDIIICSKKYFQISARLIELGIKDYYVMLEGFLYHSNANETMMPVELSRYSYWRKEKEEKNILYVQNVVCDRTCKMAAMMKREGYRVYLLYTMASKESSNERYTRVFDETFAFYTVNGIVDFVENSDFDVIHSFNAPDILTNTVLMTSKTVVFDMQDTESMLRHDSIEDLVLDYVASTKSDGKIYVSQSAENIAKRKYSFEEEEILFAENMNSSWKLVDFYERVKKREKIR